MKWALVVLLALGCEGEAQRAELSHRGTTAKRAFARATGYPHGRPGYVIDHILPLCLDGPDSVANLQWQTIAEGRVKDTYERQMCREAAKLHVHLAPTP